MKKIILLILLMPMLATAQYFDVFDIDTSEYPIMKAKFYSIDANGNQILNHTPTDFEITENGEPRDVISVSCPVQKDEPFSVVIAVDVSGSMGGEELSTLKNSLNYFIDLVPNNGSEISIIAFNRSNYFISDFTSNKSKLESRVDALIAGGGTDFDAAFMNPIAGSLLAMEKAKHSNRNVIIITDGKASGNENAIINNAKSLGTRIFGILIKNKAPNILQNIFESTQGKGFENVITEDDFKESFINIRQNFNGEPCEIAWESKPICDKYYSLNILNKISNLEFESEIQLSNTQHLSLKSDKYFINIGTTSNDTTITITSKNGDQTIKEINFELDNGNYEVLTPLPINIPKNDSIEIEIRFSPIDDAREYTKMEIIGDYCNSTIGLLKGDKNKPISQRTLVLTHPNGGEIFVAGSDTIIAWKGISDKEEVTLKFSSDRGKRWGIITDSAINLRTNWTLPNIKSDSCLVSVLQFENDSTIKKIEKIEWEKYLGNASVDHSNSLAQTYDGGYIVVGYTDSDQKYQNPNPNEIFDYWIIKLSSKGDLEWEKSYGGSNDDIANSIIQTNDGGYLVSGFSDSKDRDIKNPKGDRDYWIIKLSSKGDLEWEKSYGGSRGDRAFTLIQSEDGGYVVAGYSSSADGDIINPRSNPQLSPDYWIIKLSSKGDLEWEKSYGGSDYDRAHSILQTSDGGYAVAGHSKSKDGDITKPIGDFDYWIIKLSSKGDLEWEKSYGGSGSDYARSILQTFDGGYIVAGQSNSIGGDISKPIGDFDYWIVKLNQNGDLEWEKSYGGSDYDRAYSIIQTNDGGYFVAGYSNSLDGNITNPVSDSNYWIVKLNQNGDLEWEKSYATRNRGSNYDGANTLIQTYDESYVISVNAPENDWTLIKFRIPPPPLQSDTSDAVFSIIMPEPVIQNNDIDMGQMIVGNTKDTIVSSVICNKGDAPLHVLGVDLTSGDIGDFLIPRGAGDFFLKKDQCQDMMFEFTPSALGNRTVVATIRTTIGDFTDTINIRGVGIDLLIEATSEVVDFGQFELGDGKDTTLFLVKNVGSTDITITDTRISGPDMEQFSLYTTPITFTIPAGEEKEFQLNYTAKLGGRTSSILEFHFNGVGSPLRSMLFAEGIGGEVYPQIPDAYVGENVELGIFLGKIKPEGLSEIATNFSATVSYNSTLLAPIDKSMNVTTEFDKSYISVNGQLSSDSQIAAIPMKVGLGTADRSGLVITEFQLYNSKGDSVDYDIEPGVGEFNVLGICEEGGKRLLNPNSEVTTLKLLPNSTSTRTTAEVTLIESGETELSIFDLSGNKVQTVYSGTPNIGKEQISIDVSNLANGRYYIKLTTPTITKTEILEVVR